MANTTFIKGDPLLAATPAPTLNAPTIVAESPA